MQQQSKRKESLFWAKTADGDSSRHHWRQLKERQNMRWKAISKSHGTPSDGAKWDLALALTLSETQWETVRPAFIWRCSKVAVSCRWKLKGNLDSALVVSSHGAQSDRWNRLAGEVLQLMIRSKVTGKNRNKIVSFTRQGSKAIPAELSLNSNGHTHAGACLSWRLIAAIYSKWACAQCVFAGPDKNESLATDLETD